MPKVAFESKGPKKDVGNPVWRMTPFPEAKAVSAGATLEVQVNLASGHTRVLEFEVLKDVTAVGVLDMELVVQVGAAQRKANPTEVTRTK